MKTKLLYNIVNILLFIVTFLMAGCSKQNFSGINSEINKIDEMSQPVAELNNSNDTELSNEDNRINYTLTKLDLYSKLDLSIENKEYIYINSVDKNKVYFCYEQFKGHDELGRSKTLKIGLYDIEKDSVKFIKEFENKIFVNDVMCSNNNEIIYVCFDEKNHWYIKEISNSEELIIDEGDNFTFMPKLVKIGDRVFYLYEKIIQIDNSLEYQYGVNEITREAGLAEIDFHKISIKSENEIIEKEALISENLICSKNAVAYLVQKEQIPYVNVAVLDTGAIKNIEIDGKIHNINILNDILIMCLEDSETEKIRLNLLNYNTSDVENSDVDFPLYRMESNGNDIILAVDQNFNIFMLDLYDNNVSLREIYIEGHEKEPVLFEKVSESEFLINYGFQGQQNKELYLISVN